MYTRWATAILIGSHLANALEFLRPAAPQITANLAIRQAGQCEPMHTACADGTGCCPSGAACTFIFGQPRCAMACNGGPKCPGGGCCEIGYACDLTTDLCHPIETGFPMPSFPSPNPGGPVITSTPAPIPTSSWCDAGGSAPSSAHGGGGGGGGETSSSAAATSTQGSPTGSFGSSSAGTAVPTGPAPGVASSLSLEWESWMAWVFVCPAGLALLA